MASTEPIYSLIDSKRVELVNAVATQLQQKYPHATLFTDERQQTTDIHDQINHLTQAVAVETPALFTNYVNWSDIVLSSRNVPREFLLLNLESVAQNLQKLLAPALPSVVEEYMQMGRRELEQRAAAETLLPFILPVDPLATLASDYLALLLQGDRHQASQLILNAVQGGVTVQDIYLRVFQPTQYEIGRLWQVNQLSVAQEHFCTAVTQMIMSQLYPYIFHAEASEPQNGYTLVATSVSTELHEIGLRMVTDSLEMAGWNTYYIGANVPTAEIVQSLIERKADLLAISTTMVPHLRQLSAIIAAVRNEPTLRHVKILVGGYPFQIAPELWQKIGADGYAADAQGALRTAAELVQA